MTGILELVSLPDHARLWVYGAGRRLSEAEVDLVSRRMNSFMDTWAAHGQRLAANCSVRDDWFLLVAVDEALALASGCSIDALTREVRSLEEALGTPLLDGMRVWYRDSGGEIRCVTRPEFKELAAGLHVATDTTVFDHTLRSVGELRANRFERPAHDSWHGKLIPEARPGAQRTDL